MYLAHSLILLDGSALERSVTVDDEEKVTLIRCAGAAATKATIAAARAHGVCGGAHVGIWPSELTRQLRDWREANSAGEAHVAGSWACAALLSNVRNYVITRFRGTPRRARTLSRIRAAAACDHGGVRHVDVPLSREVELCDAVRVPALNEAACSRLKGALARPVVVIVQAWRAPDVVGMAVAPIRREIAARLLEW